jgi:hypothetical protein
MSFTPSAGWTTSHKIRPQDIPEPSKFQRVGDHMYLFRFNPQSYAAKLVISAHGGSIPETEADAWFDLKDGQTLHYYCRHGTTVPMASMFWATGRTSEQMRVAQPRETLPEQGRVHNYQLAKCEGARGSSQTYDFLQKLQDRTATTGGKFSAVSAADKLHLLHSKLERERPDVIAALAAADAATHQAHRKGLTTSTGYDNNRELVPEPMRKDFEEALYNKKFYMPSTQGIPPADDNFVDFDIATIRARKNWRGKLKDFTLKQAIEELNKIHVYTDIHCSFCRE